MKRCRAILIADAVPTAPFQEKLAEAGIHNVMSAVPAAIAAGLSFRSKLDLYVYLAGELAEQPDFECMRRLRRSSDPNVAYAPMMLVAGRLTPVALKAAVDAGFDDILIEPFGASELQARIIASITSPPIFYASAEYVGPDRRRGLFQKGGGAERRSGGARASRLVIERSLGGGCRVRRIERIDAPDDPSAEERPTA